MAGVIDIVCNLFTPEEVRNGQTGLDETFKAQVRMPEEIRGGVTIEDYLGRMDRAGIERSLLVAVRAGDINVSIPSVSPVWPALIRFVACRVFMILSKLYPNTVLSAHICIRTGVVSRLITPSIILFTQSAVNLISRS